MKDSVVVALFTYHRFEHTKKVLDGLKNNTIKPNRLYIFQDGITSGTNTKEWMQINEMINNISWCRTTIRVSNTNLGLAKSIVSGINTVLSENEEVVVLEDDCVPNIYFLEYMLNAFERYKDEKRVFSISGYRWETELISEDYDAYFNGKFCSWGWGIWKDRWEKYTQDYNLITRIKKDKGSYERLMTWGQNLESILIGNIGGTCDSWAVFMSLMIIENNGLNLCPYESLIRNVGFDGSGIHCKKIANKKMIEYNGDGKFRFPKVLEPSDLCKAEFKALRSAITPEQKYRLNQEVLLELLNNVNDGKQFQIPYKTVSIWGKGPMCDALLKNLPKNIEVQCIIESAPSAEQYKNIPIIGVKNIPIETQMIIIIPFYDIEMINYKVMKEKIETKIIGFNELVTEYMK